MIAASTGSRAAIAEVRAMSEQGKEPRTPGRRRDLVGLGRIELGGMGYGVTLDRSTNRIAIASGVAGPASTAAWVGSARVEALGELELGPRLREHLRERRIPEHEARTKLGAVLDAHGLRGLRAPRQESRADEPQSAPPPLRVVRWCEVCRSSLHDVDAHRSASAAAIAARAHLEAGDEAVARLFAAIASARHATRGRGDASR